MIFELDQLREENRVKLLKMSEEYQVAYDRFSPFFSKLSTFKPVLDPKEYLVLTEMKDQFDANVHNLSTLAQELKEVPITQSEELNTYFEVSAEVIAKAGLFIYEIPEKIQTLKSGKGVGY